MNRKDKEEKFKEAFPESAKILEEQKDITLQDRLRNPHFMRGLTWRKDKLEAVCEARIKGQPENWILEQLMLGGLTELTARKIMHDSGRLYRKENRLNG